MCERILRARLDICVEFFVAEDDFVAMFKARNGKFEIGAAEPFVEVVEAGDAAGVAVAFVCAQQHGFPGGHVRAGDGFHGARECGEELLGVDVVVVDRGLLPVVHLQESIVLSEEIMVARMKGDGVFRWFFFRRTRTINRDRRLVVERINHGFGLCRLKTCQKSLLHHKLLTTLYVLSVRDHNIHLLWSQTPGCSPHLGVNFDLLF